MHHLKPFPADEWQMTRYSRYVGNTVSSICTIQNYIGGIRKLHELAGFKAPDSNESNYKLIIQVLRVELAKLTKQAWPITPEVLREIYDQVNLQDPLEVCYTAILVRFYLFLRKSILVPDSSVSFNQNEQLTRGDLYAMGWLILINIRWSKTIQYQQKDLLMALIPSPCRAICPIYWLRYMVKRFPAQLDEPLFCYPRKGKNVALSYEHLRRLLAKWVGMTG